MAIASPPQVPLAQGKLARSFLHSTPFIQWLVTVTSSFPIPTLFVLAHWQQVGHQ
jgi:hypothetical protein